MVRNVNPAAAPATRVTGGQLQRAAQRGDFRKVLQQSVRSSREVRFSAHAAERIRQRKIELGPSRMRRVSAAAEEVAARGGRDALVVMDGVSLILDVPNRTVVTAVERGGGRSVFTNIDSAVFA